MRLDKFGERPFLDRLEELLSYFPKSRLLYNEDASDIPFNDTNIVINVDTFVASTDRLPGMSDAQMGRKTAVMTLSDLAAKGIRPVASMLSALFPRNYELENALEILRGFSQFCLRNSVRFIGGDCGLASDVILTGVAMGFAKPDEIVLRCGAQPNDIIAVSGKFGLTSIAYKNLLGGLEVEKSLLQHALIAAYNPSIDLELIRELRKQNAVTSAMDSSDGLGITLNTMANQSGVSFQLDKLPISTEVEKFALKHGLDLINLIMNGGEEFALVMTIPPDKWELARETARKSRFGLQAIGYVQEGSGVFYHGKSGMITVTPTGYDSFREWS